VNNLSITVDSSIGTIEVTASDDALTNIQLRPKPVTEQTSNSTKLMKNIINQLENYLKNPDSTFNLPLAPQGTAFQQKVWQTLQNIPSGETRTYGELAKQLNTSPRAIGNACRANPIPVIIPCHRVVGQNNDGGFMGKTTGQSLKIKQWLLEHERRN
jgi:methylated-DNA-[protein]-cysteine S-methyltransferase